MKARAFSWRIWYLLAAFGVYLVDQMSKAWAVRRLRLGQDKTIIDGFIDLAYLENTGIAFGQLQDPGVWGRYALAALAIAAAVAVLTYLFRTTRSDDRILGACALLLAGIAGNLTDRLRLGYVIDFIHIYAGNYHWPTFNVADAAICFGAGLIALDLILENRKHRQRSAVRSHSRSVSRQ